jgi:hypothetical protein
MYGSVAEASAYHAARGNIDWETLGTDTDHEIALTRGSDYIDGTYGARFAGTPTDPDQINAWPRTGATVYGSSIAGSVVPLRVIHASYEAALIELRKIGALTVLVDPAKKVKRQKVEGIEREFFEPGDSGNIFAPNSPTSTLIEGLLAPLVGPVAGLPSILVV